MREILFRGKRADNGEWIYGSLLNVMGVKQPYCLMFGSKFLFSGGVAKAMQHACVDPETVGQFTGLLDKNGKRIFEGDIIRHIGGNPNSKIREIGFVFWDENRCGWQRTSNGAFYHGEIDTYHLSTRCVYEIIGNIHDSPELLKGE